LNVNFEIPPSRTGEVIDPGALTLPFNVIALTSSPPKHVKLGFASVGVDLPPLIAEFLTSHPFVDVEFA
jgi:hypothetical protein